MIMKKKPTIIIILLAALSLASYLAASWFFNGLGYPLDDSWIHQTYARNLAQLGEWSFIPGEPSAGSTGPLWSLILSVGYFLDLGPYLWTYLMGGVSLSFLGIIGYVVFPYLSERRKDWRIWAAVLLLYEWHLVWASASGMETLAFAALAALALGCLLMLEARMKLGKIIPKWTWLVLGLLMGLSVWLRPEGVTLLGPGILATSLLHSRWRERWRSMLIMMVGFLLVFLPYLLFNFRLMGSWWPTTFYAKQAEYAFLYQKPLWGRFLEQAVIPLKGVGALLLPGFGLIIKKSIRRRQWAVMLGAVWVLGYLFMYAWRLPVTYQYGRYVMPVMPVFFLWGFAGMAEFLQLNSEKMLKRLIGRVWLLTAICVFAAFSFIGGRAYASDVAIIESEMVTIAHWIKENTPEDALVATHDIGALGYFSERKLVDLAGLISPEVIPYLWDEAHLATYLDDRGAQYLVTFPGWFPALVERAALIYQTNTSFSPNRGGENMAVYEWKIP